MANNMTEYSADFEKARKLFPGVKRGHETEFNCLKKHKDWKNVVSLLYPAIKEQIRRRNIKLNTVPRVFVPPWKHFKTWLNNRCWEETEGTDVDAEEKARLEKASIEREKNKEREYYSGWLRERSDAQLKEILNDKNSQYSVIPKWLIREIIAAKAKL